jgi:glutamate synthase domain-containing protein 3
MSVVVDASKNDLRSISAKLKELIVEQPVTIKKSGHLHGLAAGYKGGELIVQGDSGDYLGALIDGATIRVTGNAGRYLADNMTSGTVIVEGDAGYGAGQYCYGGTMVIRGSAGDFTGVMNKGATLIVEGDVGDEAATYMLAGDLIILGSAGANLGNYLIRGTIYIGGTWTSLGHNTLKEEGLSEADRANLRSLFDRYGVEGDPESLTKIVRLSERPFYKAKPVSLADQAPLPAPLGSTKGERLCQL